MLKDYFSYALKSLRRRKLRSWLTMVGIFIGIAAVVSLIGLGQGLQYAVTNQFGSLGTDKLTISASSGFGPPGTGVINPLTTEDLERIRGMNGVERVAGRLVDPIKIEFNDRADFSFMGSMPEGEDGELVREAIDIEIAEGRDLKDSDTGAVVVGGNYAKDDNAFEQKVEVGSKLSINDRRFTVVGIMEKKGSFILDNVVIMNEDEYRDVAGIDDTELDLIVAQVSQGADMDLVKSDIERYLRRERDVKEGEEDFEVSTPQAIFDQVKSTLFAVNLFVYIIAGISILVGGIGIMNTMYTAVMERTKEIGIMKAIGAKNSTIFGLFFVESGLIGSVGGIVGAALGAGLSIMLASVGKELLDSDLITAQISPWLVSGAILGSFAIGSLFGILPAMKATKLHPVDALRQGK